MAEQPSRTKSQSITTWVGIILGVMGIALPYFLPPDPLHPIKFDFIYKQISISVWSFAAFIVGTCVLSILIFRMWSRQNQESTSTTNEWPPLPAITTLSQEYLRLENDHNDLKNRLFEAKQSLSHSTDQINALRRQLEVPKIAISVVTFDVFEEVAKVAPGEIARLVHRTNNRILIHVQLRIVNEHRAATNIQGFGIVVRGIPSGPLENSAQPADFPSVVRQPIQFGFPVDVALNFWLDHSDAQSIVKSYFVVAATDGTGVQVETSPVQIIRVFPRTSGAAATLQAVPQPKASIDKRFDFDPKQMCVRLNPDEIIALEVSRNANGTLGILLAPVNTTPRVISHYQVEVIEASSWNDRHGQFIPVFGFSRKSVIRGQNLQAVSKQNSQWLVRVARKEGKDFLTIGNDDSTPISWPNDDPVDVETWRFTLVTVHGSEPLQTNAKFLHTCYLLIQWDRKHSTMVVATQVEPMPDATSGSRS